MRAAIIYNTDYTAEGRVTDHGVERPVKASIIDMDRRETELIDGKYPNTYHPAIWTGESHSGYTAARIEAETWAASQGLTLHEAPEPIAVTGAEADIEANYPGGYAAYLRDERPSGLTAAQEATAVETGQISGASAAD